MRCLLISSQLIKLLELLDQQVQLDQLVLPALLDQQVLVQLDQLVLVELLVHLGPFV